MSYVYLDWNVVKYMKSHRRDCNLTTDEYFTSLIFGMAKKGVYSFPYSEAHIKDRSNQYNPAYRTEVIKDFNFFGYINQNMCLGIVGDSSNLSMHFKKMIDFFDENINSPVQVPSRESFLKNAFQIYADMDKICEDNPLYELLKNSNGHITEDDMATFLEEQFSCIFRDANSYKKMRNYLPYVNLESDDAHISYMTSQYAHELFVHLGPFIKSVNDDEISLSLKWKEICESWFSLNHPLPISKSQLLVQGYTLLDMHPLFYDKLKKGKNTLNNILNDGTHVYYASEAKYFVSEDSHTRKKAKFIYTAFGIDTKVLSEKEFLDEIGHSNNVVIEL